MKMPLSSLDPILSPVLRETRRVECVTGVPLCNGKMTAVFNYQDATVIVSSLASGSRMCRESRVSKKKSMDLVRFFFFLNNKYDLVSTPKRIMNSKFPEIFACVM